MQNSNNVPLDMVFDNYSVIDRKPYSEYLTVFLNSKAENGYVLNLNAEWGAGKTTFLQCWYNELKKGHPVVYFDAWKSDFTHDAMLALLETFHSQLLCAITENKELFEKLLTNGSYFIKSALPSLITGYVKHKTGMGEDESLMSEFSEDIKIDSSALTDALKETIKAMLSQKKKVEGVQNFKETLQELSTAYLEIHHNKKAPIYVLIDELDRCRPTYAIEVIESVKHFFNTDNFVFVIATDTDQLQHSIKAVYGEGFDSNSYLSRFFDRTITLQAPTLHQFLTVKLEKLAIQLPSQIDYIKLLIHIFTWHGITSLREISKIIDTITIAAAHQARFNISILVLCSVLKLKHPEKYNALKKTGANPYFNTKSEIPRSKSNHLSAVSTTEINILLFNYKIHTEHMMFMMIRTLLSPEPIGNDISMAEKMLKDMQSRSSRGFNGTEEMKFIAINTNLYTTHGTINLTKNNYFDIIDFIGYTENVDPQP